MLKFIEINESSIIPKYRQIVNSIRTALEKGDVKLNDKLPSVNELLIEFDISRDTVVRAYDHLKKLNIIQSIPGKGYYIKKDNEELQAKVFLLFNKLSAHKKLIYDAFSKELGNNATIDFFIYENNYRQFKSLIQSTKERDYTHYVIICHFEEGGDDLENFIKDNIPLEKLLILDKQYLALNKNIASVYQDFERNIYTALVELNHLLKKYKKIKLLFREKTYHPIEIKQGFLKFCLEYAYDFEIIDTIESEYIEKNTAYINLMENDLILLIKKIRSTKFQLGNDVGIISYNETAIKGILLDGITVISTDFEQLGKHAAKLILKNEKKQIENPFYTIVRKSL
ncbi:regulatory GntR family protein [Maribacter caenipelagi]|uniref:Regulatory GntR family protein n=1 Tax=Maribacter caenipelagi TaxID=1447781 RepID=A0A4R7D246_9FLAO|nr:GntR family transcriptional regulator [Maribacter caenipelagi]TDS14342.1 regulatory GntR family protein [Maribacter caenipelagi]